METTSNNNNEHKKLFEDLVGEKAYTGEMYNLVGLSIPVLSKVATAKWLELTIPQTTLPGEDIGPDRTLRIICAQGGFPSVLHLSGRASPYCNEAEFLHWPKYNSLNGKFPDTCRVLFIPVISTEFIDGVPRFSLLDGYRTVVVKTQNGEVSGLDLSEVYSDARYYITSPEIIGIGELSATGRCLAYYHDGCKIILEDKIVLFNTIRSVEQLPSYGVFRIRPGDPIQIDEVLKIANSLGGKNT